MADTPAVPTPTPLSGEPAAAPPETPENGTTPSTEEAKPVRTPEEYETELAKVRREAHGLRTKLREVEPLAKKAQEADEAAKTETQKAEERAQAAEKAHADLQIGYTRMELAVTYNIPPEDIGLIGSGTREEMDANAQRLAALNAAARKAAPPPTDRPVEGLRPGATPDPAKEPDDSYPAAWKPSYLREKEERSFHGQ